MKKVISGTLLQEKMGEAINLLCGTVKTTLGPKGSNIIIDHSSFSPFITNDGVTIAENIESDTLERGNRQTVVGRPAAPGIFYIQPGIRQERPEHITDFSAY